MGGNSLLAEDPMAEACDILYNRPAQMLELASKALLASVALLAAILLFSPYEAFLEGVIAITIVTTALIGFLLHPRKQVFFVQTGERSNGPDGANPLEREFVAVRVEAARLWLLFIPTFVAVAFLIFFAASGPEKFSSLNWLFSSSFAVFGTFIAVYGPVIVLVLLYAWVDERKVLRDCEACAAKSFRLIHSSSGRTTHVSYAFCDEHGESFGGYCMYFGLVHPWELANIVFHNVRKPESSKIAMGFLFHRLIVVSRGVKEMDKETMAAQMLLVRAAR